MNEKKYTQEQLQKKVNRIRRIMGFVMSVSDKLLRKPKIIVGKKLLLSTDEGAVKVLAYNLENSDTLPLFVNIHGKRTQHTALSERTEGV